MKKIIKFLNMIFAPTVNETFYYNDKKVEKLPKEAKETFKRMKEMVKDLEKMLDNL